MLLLIAVFVIFSVLDPRFFDLQTLTSVARNTAYIGIVAVGMTLVLMTAGIDLAVGSVLYLSAVVVGQVIRSADLPVFLVPILAIVVGIVLGSINGFIVSVLRVDTLHRHPRDAHRVPRARTRTDGVTNHHLPVRRSRILEAKPSSECHCRSSSSRSWSRWPTSS